MLEPPRRHKMDLTVFDPQKVAKGVFLQLRFSDRFETRGSDSLSLPARRRYVRVIYGFQRFHGF